VYTLNMAVNPVVAHVAAVGMVFDPVVSIVADGETENQADLRKGAVPESNTKVTQIRVSEDYYQSMCEFLKTTINPV